MYNVDEINYSDSSYSPFERDIAKVQVYFKTATLIQYGSHPYMTWVDFFSNIGGTLGLVLGMGIVSLFELFWLGFRLISLRF